MSHRIVKIERALDRIAAAKRAERITEILGLLTYANVERERDGQLDTAAVRALCAEMLTLTESKS